VGSVDFKDLKATPKKVAQTAKMLAANAVHLAGLLKLAAYPWRNTPARSLAQRDEFVRLGPSAIVLAVLLLTIAKRTRGTVFDPGTAVGGERYRGFFLEMMRNLCGEHGDRGFVERLAGPRRTKLA
jgi:hypothetical protein